MLLFTLLILSAFVAVIYTETINRDISNDYTNVTCSTFPCIINCNAGSSCRTTNISCPLTGQGDCTINIFGSSAGYESTIFTHSSTNINISIEGSSGLRYSTIYAHTQIGAKLRITTGRDHSMRNSKLFAPYGEGSELTMICGNTVLSGNYQCHTGEYFDDYSTTVRIVAYRNYAVENTIIRNIFTDNSYFNITKPTNIDINYRASVTLLSVKAAFDNFIYYGRDHGDWDISSSNPDTGNMDFVAAYIYAQHSFVTNESYTVTVSSLSQEAMQLNLYVAQNNGNIVLNGLAKNAFWNGDTGTKYLQVYCLPTLTNGDAYVLNSFTAFADGESAFYKSTLNINTTVRQVKFISYQYLGFRGKGKYTFGNVLENVEFIANGTSLTLSYREFNSISVTIASIGGDLLIGATTELGETFYNSILTVTGDIGGDIIMQDNTVNGGYLCTSSDITVGNVFGKVELSQTGAQGYMFNTVTFICGFINGDLLITDTAGTGRAIYNAVFITGDIAGDVIIKDLSGASGGLTCYSTEFTFGHVAGKVDMIITGQIGRSFETAKFIMDSIGGRLLINDTAVGGKGFYNGFFTVNGDIGADVIINDDSVTIGYTVYSTEFTFGNIVGRLDMIVDGVGGHSFENAIFNIASIGGTLIITDAAEKGHSLKNTVMTVGNIGGDVIIRDESIWAGSTGGRTCYSAEFIFNDVSGKLELISIAAGYGYSFELATFNINSIDGNLTAHDMSEDGRSFLDSYFNIGTVAGSVLFRDDSFGTAGGNAVQSADIIIRNVYGDVDLIDAGINGRAFYATNFDFQYIGGSLYADAIRGTVNNQAFRQADFVIGTIIGNFTFKSYISGAFYGVDTASTLVINNISNYVYLYSVGDYGLRNLHSVFGGNPNVEVIVESGSSAIYSSMFDCRDCNSFTLRCNNDADCDGSVDIWCPENNSQDTCKIYCSQGASCNGMDIFTTNGYCQDVRVYCLDEINHDCTFGANTKIYCTNNGAVAYGSTSHSCLMAQDITRNNLWWCGTGVCSNTCTNKPTKYPTPAPTINPTPAPTNNPTPAPTINPTNAPSFSPISKPTESPHTPGDPSRAPTQTTDTPTYTPTPPPTNYPTYDPTIDPTNDPTVDPTYNPTIDPTENPTFNPTSVPSISPTITPTKPAGVMTTDTIENSNDNGNLETDGMNTFIKNNLMMIIVAGLIVAVLIVLCAIFCVYTFRKKSGDSHKNMLNLNDKKDLNRVKSLSTLASDTDTHMDGETIEMTTPQKPAMNVVNDDYKQGNKANNEMMNLYGNNNALKMWLSNLGMDEYLETFKEQGFSDQIVSLCEITEQDLKDMGVNKIAHRRTLMKNIQILKNNIPTNNNNNNNIINVNIPLVNQHNIGGEELYDERLNQSINNNNNNNNKQFTAGNEYSDDNSHGENDEENSSGSDMYGKKTSTSKQ